MSQSSDATLISCSNNSSSRSSLLKYSGFSKRTVIRSILCRDDGGAGLAGEQVTVGGWVRTGREQGRGRFAFLEINDGSCISNLQVMVDSSVYELGLLLHAGTSVSLSGELKHPPGESCKQKIELKANKVIHVGLCDPQHYPLPKGSSNSNNNNKGNHDNSLSLEYLRDFLHLRPRTTKFSSVTRIRNALAYATHTFFQQNGFVYIQTPIITTTDCDGAGASFQVTTLLKEVERVAANANANPSPPSETIITEDDEQVVVDYSRDFFGRAVYLNGSGQLQAESFASALGNVYTFGPTFRAEHSHTSRHLAEFWMVEPEMPFAHLEDVMNCAEAYVKFMCQWLLDNCIDDLEFITEKFDKAAIERLKMVTSTPFIRITYTEAVTLLKQVEDKKFENKVQWGIDFASEHERYLTDVLFKKPVILSNYPKEIKAFDMRVNDDGKTVAAMDILVPKVGELVGGSQREERLDIMRRRIAEMGLSLEPYEWYLDLRRYGTVEHSGFGLGFERMLLFATGIDNIRDVIPFPRCPRRADF